MEHLGSGQFGTVNKGVWQSPGGAVEVAVKMLKSGSDETDEVKFLQEAAIMGQFKHPNVIKLHGVVTVGKPVSIAYTVEPLNKGHFGSRTFVLFSEVVLWWEVRANMQFIAPSRPNIPR